MGERLRRKYKGLEIKFKPEGPKKERMKRLLEADEITENLRRSIKDREKDLPGNRAPKKGVLGTAIDSFRGLGGR